MNTDGSLKGLVDRARDGDRAAFDELIGSYRTRLASLVRSRLGAELESQMSVDDVVQETVLGALRSIDRFTWRGDDSFLRWLGSIAENILRKAHRKRRDRSLLRVDPPSPDQISPSRAMRRDERFDRLEHALRDLSEDHKQVIVLSRIEGLKSREIAAHMNRSEGAVRKLLVRALAELRKSFGETESFELPARRLDPGPDA